ncbi:MAG: methyltransferase domain-containing protein [Pseudonocardiaceae bacterium]
MQLPLRPISDCYGYDRGTPVDRIYIEAFLDQHRHDIRGHGAEIKTDSYLRRFGRDQIRLTTVIDIDPDNPWVRLRADLCQPASLPTDTFDCILLTQTLQLLANPAAALANCHQALRPSGALLVTVPCVGRISPSSRSQDRWRFTPAGLRELFTAWDGPVTVTGHGNLRACLAALLGEAAEDLTSEDLEHHDPDFPLVACTVAHRMDPR